MGPYRIKSADAAFLRTATNHPEIGLHSIYLGSLLPDDALQHLVCGLHTKLKENERMLVFFPSCEDADVFAEKLSCAVFHSKLPDQGNTKDFNLARWDAGETLVMACTSAFGAGVDRPNVRFIVIYNPSYNLQQTMQMVGRAGRDGRPSHAFFATSQQAAPSKWKKKKTTNLRKELGKVVYGKDCRVYEASLHMDGELLARRCEEIPNQICCDVCEPDSEMHLFAVRAVAYPGMPVAGIRRLGHAAESGTASHSDVKRGKMVERGEFGDRCGVRHSYDSLT